MTIIIFGETPENKPLREDYHADNGRFQQLSGLPMTKYLHDIPETDNLKLMNVNVTGHVPNLA